MNHSEADYIRAGFKFERASSPQASTAQAYTIRAMLTSESPEDQQEARRLIEQGRQEARQCSR